LFTPLKCQLKSEHAVGPKGSKSSEMKCFRDNLRNDDHDAIYREVGSGTGPRTGTTKPQPPIAMGIAWGGDGVLDWVAHWQERNPRQLIAP